MRRKIIAALLMTTALVASSFTALASSEEWPTAGIVENQEFGISGKVPDVGADIGNGKTWDPSQYEVQVKTVKSTGTYDPDAKYMFSIPREVELVRNGSTAEGTYQVSVTAKTSVTGESIFLVPSVSSLLMTAADGSGNVTATISQSKTEWTMAEATAATPVIGTGTITASGLSDDTEYTGTFYFSITQGKSTN